MNWFVAGVVEWRGVATYDPATERLASEVTNRVGGGTRTGTWRRDPDEPSRLLVDWTRSDGCRGVGNATRAPAP